MMTDSSNAGAVEHFDTGPLSWVMGEIRDALAQSAALVVQAASQEPGARQAGLRQARIFLHQAHGALQMVDVDGVTVVTGAAESILEGLREEGQPLSAPIAEAMADAFQAVGEYLEALLAGAPHQPVRLFPYYQALLQAHGGGRIHPSDLFFPDLAVRPKLPPAPPGARTDTAALRQRYEKALLPFLKSTERAAELSSAAVMRDVLAEVERAPQDDEARAFWWVMRGFAALGAEGGLASEVYVKQVFARINLQLRRLGQAGVVNERVLRDALFFIAQAGDPPPEAAQIRQVYRLEGMVPEDFSSRRYGRIDEQALAAAREQLAQAKSLWNRVAAGDGAAAAAFGQAMQGLTAAGGRLDSPSLAKLLRELNGIARHAAHSNPGDTLGLEVAGSLLFIENALAHASRLADDFPQRADALTARLLALVAGERPGEETQWLDDMSRAAQQRETMLAVAGEMQASLAQVEKNLDEYFSNPAHQGVLEPTDAVLHQIEGALAIIDQDEARQAVVHLREALRGFAQAGPGHADQEAFRRVAGNVGALSFFIENLQVDSEGAAKRFGFDPESGVFQSRLLEQRGGTAREVVVDPLPQSWAGESGVETIELAPPPAEPETAGPAAAAESPAEPRDELLAEPSGTLAQSAAASPAGSPEMEPAAFAPAAGAGEDAVAGHENWLEPDDAPDADATVAAMPVQVAPANPLPASDEAADAELLEIFLTEASEVLETVQAATPELRRDPGSLEHMTTLRRSFHTLKGSSRMVGLAVFGEAAWAIEQVFNRRLADGQEGSPELYSLLDLAVEELGGWVAELAQSGHSARNGAALVAAAHRVRNGQPALADAETEVQAQERGAAAPPLPSHPEDADPVLAPAIPDTPAAPGMPELPDMADAIAEPAVAGMPGPGELPEAIGMAEASDAAAGSDTQKAADIPEAADVSAAPDMPAAPDTLEPSDAANASDVPAASEATEAAGLTETPGMADSYAMPESRGAGQASGTGEGAAAAQPAPTGKVIEFPDVHRTQLPADDNVKHIGALEISVPLHNIYLAETDELVRLLAQDLAEWRHEPERAVNILAVHAAHSLAGSSATVGFAAVHEIAHALEMILQQLARKHVPLKPAEFDAAE
ncbi:MAG: Hpt domain-containing protein, partial [Noviherbaspirillum sp.]